MTTKYLISVVHPIDGTLPTGEAMERIHADVSRFNDTVREAGRWVYADGLTEISDATTVRHGENGDLLVSDGPFVEAKEYMGGFWIIEADDLDEALDWAKKGARACQADVELRPFQNG